MSVLPKIIRAGQKHRGGYKLSPKALASRGARKYHELYVLEVGGVPWAVGKATDLKLRNSVQSRLTQLNRLKGWKFAIRTDERGMMNCYRTE